MVDVPLPVHHGEVVADIVPAVRQKVAHQRSLADAAPGGEKKAPAVFRHCRAMHKRHAALHHHKEEHRQHEVDEKALRHAGVEVAAIADVVFPPLIEPIAEFLEAAFRDRAHQDFERAVLFP